MVKIDINERISWEDYFNHSFFNQQWDKIEENINTINLNYIICEYEIKELNKLFQILNCLDEEGTKRLKERYKKKAMKDYKLEIKDNEINNKNCELILNNNKLIFVQNIHLEKKENMN